MPRLADVVLTKTLNKYADMGFKLSQEDDHFLLLEHDNQVVARFNAAKAEIEAIQKVCCQHFNEDMFARLNSEYYQAHEDDLRRRNDG